jgi:hypothetical protein
MKEVFKEVQGYKGYFVSNKGRVKYMRLLKSGKYSERYLTCDPDKMSVRLKNDDGTYRSVKLANVVAESFLGEPSKGRRRVRHIDGNPQNNTVTNLAWDGINREDVVEIRKMLEEGYSMGEVGRKFNINRTHVRRIKDKEVWK